MGLGLLEELLPSSSILSIEVSLVEGIVDGIIKVQILQAQKGIGWRMSQGSSRSAGIITKQ